MAEIQLLSAVMMQNTTKNKFVHFFSPTITKMMQETFQFYDQIKHEGRTDLCEKWKGHLQYLQDYIECVGDLFEHKFLVFLCNPSSFHWITFVMINPSLIYLRGDSSKNRMTILVNLLVGWSSTLWATAKQIYNKQKKWG